MRFKLVDLFETKYFYVTTGKDLTYALSTCEKLRTDANVPYNAGNAELEKLYSCVKNGAPVEFDLAGAKITSDVTTILRLYMYRGFTFVDSEWEWRDKLFAEGRERIALKDSLKDVVPLPPFDLNTLANEYVSNLSKDVIYEVPVGQDEIYIPLCVLICIYRPSVRLLLDNVFNQVFKFVSKHLTEKDLDTWSEFYVIEPEGVSIWKRGDKLHIQRLGYCELEDALTVADFVPTVFGSERLANDVIFREVAKDCISRLNHYKMSKPVNLSDII